MLTYALSTVSELPVRRKKKWLKENSPFLQHSFYAKCTFLRGFLQEFPWSVGCQSWGNKSLRSVKLRAAGFCCSWVRNRWKIRDSIVKRRVTLHKEKRKTCEKKAAALIMTWIFKSSSLEGWFSEFLSVVVMSDVAFYFLLSNSNCWSLVKDF